MREHRIIFKLRNGWRAGYIERCKSGSEGGSRKPDPEMGAGAGFLPYVLCYAPTRSGKGISLVLPTLLDGWRESVFVLDIKSENNALSAGYRKKELGQKILKLDFTDPDAISKGTSATFNPLEEVKLDYIFDPGKRLPDPSNPEEAVFRLVPSGTSSETASIQQIVAIIVDPNGKGMSDHWEKTASSLMLGPKSAGWIRCRG